MSTTFRSITLSVIALALWRAERAVGLGLVLALAAIVTLAWVAMARTPRRRAATRPPVRSGQCAPNAPRLDATLPIPSTYADGQDSFYYFESRPDALLGLRDEPTEQVPWDDHPFLTRPVVFTTGRFDAELALLARRR